MSEFDSIFKHTALTVNCVQDIGVHLQEVGREYGTTTGRRRRCGWLDLVVMQHSCLINGYDSLNLTKLDILDDLEEIKVAVKYVIDGKELSGFPGTPLFLNACDQRSLIPLVFYFLISGPGRARKGRGCLCDVARMETIDSVCQAL